MNRFEYGLWLEAMLTLCPGCENRCDGAENCVKLAERIVERKAEITAEK